MSTHHKGLETTEYTRRHCNRTLNIKLAFLHFELITYCFSFFFFFTTFIVIQLHLYVFVYGHTILNAPDLVYCFSLNDSGQKFLPISLRSHDIPETQHDQ